MMLRTHLPRLALLALLSLTAPLALAMDRDEAAAQVQQSTGGRVLGVERSEQGGQPVFKVKVLTPSGEVRIVIVNAKGSGR